MKTIIQELKEENKNMKNEINDLIQKVNLLMNNNNNNSFNNQTNECFSLYRESFIVTNFDDENLISSWILPKGIIKYKRIYRASQDGDTISDYHRLCDEKGPILLIAKTKNNYIFGGFTRAKLEKNKSEIADPHAFVFSLNTKQYFKTKEPKYSLHNCIYEGPIFGGSNYAFEIFNNILTNNNHYSNPNNTYGNNMKLVENQRFSISELEVFIVEF